MCTDVSLNSLCIQGPDFAYRLFDVFIPFREFPFVLIAEITAMYNQVEIPNRDRDALRCVWMKNNDVKQYRMTFHYSVDDLLWSSKSLDEATQLMPMEKSLTKYCAGQNIEWSFHPPGASHMNGACKRMIRTIRKVLTGMLTDRCRLTDDIINTLFTEVESIVKHRPLTKVNDDVAEDLPLTPAHLLMVRCSSQDLIGNFSKGDMYRRRWRYVHYLADVFWKRYFNEYLPELQKRNKWYNRERR